MLSTCAVKNTYQISAYFKKICAEYPTVESPNLWGEFNVLAISEGSVQTSGSHDFSVLNQYQRKARLKINDVS